MPTEIDGKQVYPRASIGICISDEDLLSQDTEELLRNADVAMYMAKRDSKGRYRLFEPAMHERVVERLELRAELAAGARARPARGLLPAGRSPELRHRLRRRGAPALAPPDPRPDPADAVHPARRGDRADHPDRQMGDRAKPARRQSSCSAASRCPSQLRMSVNLSVKQMQSDSIVEDVRGDPGIDAAPTRLTRPRGDGDGHARRRGRAQRRACTI